MTIKMKSFLLATIVFSTILLPLTVFSQKVSVDICFTNGYNKALDGVEVSVYTEKGKKLRQQPELKQYSPGCYNFELPRREKLMLRFIHPDTYEYLENVTDTTSHLVLGLEMEEAVCFLFDGDVFLIAALLKKGATKKSC